MREMLKALAPSLVASGFAALLGGSVTYFALADSTQKQLVMGAYHSYLPEAVRALTIAQKEELTKKDILRLGTAGAILTMYATDEVMCRAMNFERCIEHDVEKGRKKYADLAQAMREEATGEPFGRALEACVPPP